MIIRQLNEFVRESCVLALEPARHCIAHCTYCAPALNSKSQYAFRSKSLADDSSFERKLEACYSSSYDPTDFLQWCLRNSLTCGFANTVEPFQDIDQARACLKLCNQFNIPLFFQSKGIHFDEVKDLLLPLRDNCSFFVSIPTLDDRAIRRFEPGTPPASKRLEMISWLADHGFWVIGALAPYHEDWCDDPLKMVHHLYNSGIDEIFLDRLHLNQRQRAVAGDRVMVSLAGNTMGDRWPAKMIDHMMVIHSECATHGLDFFSPSFVPTCYGRFNTLPAISPDVCFSRGNTWPYYDGKIFRELESIFYSDGINPAERDPDDSILLTWSDALAIMENDGGIDQPFSYKSLYDLIPIGRKVPAEWKKSIADPAPIRDWFRAFFNSPYKNQFLWRHPWIQVAVRPDGVPWLDDDGNLQALFDPDWPGTGMFRKEESLDNFRTLEYEGIQE